MKIVVLGGGQQGRVIARDLASKLPEAQVTVADLRPPAAGTPAGLRWIEADLSDPATLVRLVAEHDLAVGALPSRLGYAAMRAAIDARRPMVDVSFSAEDPLQLNAEARAAEIAIVPDCGLAPGLSHLLAGRFVSRHGTPRKLTILVGGVAEDPAAPYGYVVTWSLADLVEEYTRPARIVRDGAAVELPALSELETVSIPGAGEMEAFLSDGLRTLLATHPEIRDMEEKTLRWPGHVAAIGPLLSAGTLERTFADRCAADPPRDRVVMAVRAEWEHGHREAVLLDRYEPATALTAMARTTALTTATVARLTAEGGVRGTGVLPLERLARDEAATDFVLDGLGSHGVRLTLS